MRFSGSLKASDVNFHVAQNRHQLQLTVGVNRLSLRTSTQRDKRIGSTRYWMLSVGFLWGSVCS